MTDLLRIFRKRAVAVGSESSRGNVEFHYDDFDACIGVMVNSFPTRGYGEGYSCAFFIDPEPGEFFVPTSVKPKPGVVYRAPVIEKPVATLKMANEIKLQTIARRLRLEPRMRVLDIGCGDGALAYYLAKEHGVSVLGITLSQKQLERAQSRDTPNIEFRLMNYRDVPRELGQFDRVVSIGMLEHVGYNYLHEFALVVRHALLPDGRALIHTIYRSQNRGSGQNSWINTYIFPGGYIPSANELGWMLINSGLKIQWFHHHNGEEYARTLAVWRRRLNIHWKEIADQVSKPERLNRTMNFYLGGCEAWFSVTDGAVVQLELVPV